MLRLELQKKTALIIMLIKKHRVIYLLNIVNGIWRQRVSFDMFPANGDKSFADAVEFFFVQVNVVRFRSSEGPVTKW